MLDKIIDWSFIAIFISLSLMLIVATVVTAMKGAYIISLLLGTLSMPVMLMALITYAAVHKS